MLLLEKMKGIRREIGKNRNKLCEEASFFYVYVI